MIAILSDIHGNFPALKSVIFDAVARGCKRFISLGDVVGYYAQPNECINLLEEYNVINILGNHDAYLVHNTICKRSKVVASIIEDHKKIVTGKQLNWLKKSLISLQENDILFVHGGPEDPQDQYLYTISENIFPSGVNMLFSGHTHVQNLTEFGEKKFCNPGSVGQPRDGDNRAGYAILSSGNVTLHRVPYEIESTVVAMKKRGYEPFCYENLYIGAQIGGRIDHIRILKEGIKL